MGFGAKPSPYSPELAVSECSQLSEGLGAKLWCVKGITIFFYKTIISNILAFGNNAAAYLRRSNIYAIIYIKDGDIMSKAEYLINYLLSERDDLGRIEMPKTEQGKFKLYRSLVNIRPAVKADESFLQAEDEYLTALTESKGITDIADLSPAENSIYLWQGDITALRCGAIVNAANSGMTGCLELAVQNNIESIAFCCISTGVFGFPKDKAAEIAVRTVREFCKTHSIRVIFDVFGDDDRIIYKKALGQA